MQVDPVVSVVMDNGAVPTFQEWWVVLVVVVVQSEAVVYPGVGSTFPDYSR